MNEIKFACPHCQQHIACDPGFVDMCIVCPTCAKPMIVPVLSAGDASHPQMCVVAAVPTPKRKLSSRLPSIEMWQAEAWEEHLNASEAAATPPVPHWVMCAFATTVLIGFLTALRAPSWLTPVSLIVGGALTVYYLFKGSEFGQTSSAYSVIKWTLLLIVGIPAILVGVAFIGCCIG